MKTVDDAILITTKAHYGQEDKQGFPYILHPLRVMGRFQDPLRMKLGVMHDTIEDTDLTLVIVTEEGFSTELVQALDAISKRPGESHEDYLWRCAENPAAFSVKWEDVADNRSRTSFVLKNCEPTQNMEMIKVFLRLRAKYEAVTEIMNQILKKKYGGLNI